MCCCFSAAPCPQVTTISDFQKQKSQADIFSHPGSSKKSRPSILWPSKLPGGRFQAAFRVPQLRDRSTPLRKRQVFVTTGLFPE